MIYTTAIQKGGTGKTTTAVALAQATTYKGGRCLAIDLDPQGNMSFALSADMNQRGCYELLNGVPASELIQHTASCDVISAGRSLATIASGKGTARRLQKALEPIRELYDIIIIDTPPTAGELQYNALQASDGLIIPLHTDVYCIQSFYQIVDTARQIQATNPKLQITGLVLTQYDGRSTIARQMRQAIEKNADTMNIPMLSVIRSAVALKEAVALQKSLYEYAPQSKPAQDYLKLYDVLLK